MNPYCGQDMLEYAGYAGELQYRVVNPQGAAMFDRDGSTPLGGRGIPAGTVIMGTPRGDGYTVEVASGGFLGWVHALDLQQITSAPPSPVLRTGVDPNLPPELAAALQYYQSLAQQPAALVQPPPRPPPPPPHTGYGYVGDGTTVVPVLPCPPGQEWNAHANGCMPTIPFPPPESPMPPTLDDWRHQHPIPSPVHTGWNLFEDVLNLRDPFKGNKRGQRDLKRDQWRGRHQNFNQGQGGFDQGQQGFDQGQGQQGFDQGQSGFDLRRGHHPHHPFQGQLLNQGQEHERHEVEERNRQHMVGVAAAQASTAQGHAQAAQVAASHPAARATGSGAGAKHAQAASNHAALAAHHTTLASAHPTAHGAAEHARLATAHTQAAAAHAEGAHADARGDHEGSREIGRSVDRAFGFREGHPRPLHGFGGRFGGGYGHPAWGREIDPRFYGHSASCWRQGPYGCYVEQIFGPSGDVCYRVTPAGEQENIELESDEQDANATYQENTGEAAPTADDGKLPGSDQSSDGSQAPAADAGGDATADAGDAGDAAGDTATGWYMSFSDPWGNYDYSAPGAWDSHYDYPGLGLSSTHNPYYSYPYGYPYG